MTQSIQETIAAAVARLVALAAADPDLRELGRRFAAAYLDATAATGVPLQANPFEPTAYGAAEADPTLVPHEQAAPSASSVPEAPLPSAADLIADLKLGRSFGPAASGTSPLVTPPTPIVSSSRSGTSIDLQLVERRALLKAEGCSWARRRAQLIAEGADFRTEVEPLDKDLIYRARETPDCFLWMSTPDSPVPADPEAWDLLAHCFETFAAAIAHMRRVEGRDESTAETVGRAVDLLAEAQSAVRVAVLATGGTEDRDQKLAYEWLAEETDRRRVYVERYMRIADPADPQRWADLESRIEKAEELVEQRSKAESKRKKLLGKVQHKVSMICRGERVDESWRILFESLDTLVEGGLPPSDVRLRDALIPILDEVPEEALVPERAERVLVSLDEFLASRPPSAAGRVVEQNESVRTLRERLGGRSIVLIGGHERREAAAKLRKALGIEELYWLSTRPHESITQFEPYVARPEVAVVVVAIRWASHSYGAVKEYCDAHGKPFVRLTGGYNPNQLATQVMEQCSERL